MLQAADFEGLFQRSPRSAALAPLRGSPWCEKPTPALSLLAGRSQAPPQLPGFFSEVRPSSRPRGGLLAHLPPPACLDLLAIPPPATGQASRLSGEPLASLAQPSPFLGSPPLALSIAWLAAFTLIALHGTRPSLLAAQSDPCRDPLAATHFHLAASPPPTAGRSERAEQRQRQLRPHGSSSTAPVAAWLATSRTRSRCGTQTQRTVSPTASSRDATRAGASRCRRLSARAPTAPSARRWTT